MSWPTGGVAALFDTVAEDYETVGPAFFDHFGALLVEHTGVRRGDRVLDLAAGSGAVTVPALAATGPQGALLAVDLADGMVRRLSDRLRASGHPDARAVVGDVAALPASPEPFDVVLCGFALFFLADPPAALRSWTQVLRPGGRLGLSTWAREDEVFGALRELVGALGVDTRARGEAFDDVAVLRRTLVAAGLADVSVSTVTSDLVLSDVDELLRWAGTHGARAWLGQLDPARTARLRAGLRERWPGSVPMTWQAHLASGCRPAAGGGDRADDPDDVADLPALPQRAHDAAEQRRRLG